MPESAHFDLNDAALVVEVAGALAHYDSGGQNAVSGAIAGHIADYIGDSAALQIGLGKVPDAVLTRLIDRRGLRMQSGMISDSVRALAEGGALDPVWLHTSCVHVGTAAHYGWLRGRNDFAVLGCEVTHSAAVLAQAGGLVAVNGAIEVDLYGQANLEYADGVRISSVGGAPDFARAARRDPAGVSVVGLPATAQKGAVSRIVPILKQPASLPTQDVEVVVTEFGSADLRGVTGDARADLLICIAHPDHRAALMQDWERR